MGDESFAPLSRCFWQHAPPQRGDVAQWGAALPDFLDASPQLDNEPFLGDVARVEWALHAASTAKEATFDVGSFRLLASGDPEDTTLGLSDGVMTLVSATEHPLVLALQAGLSPDAALTSDCGLEHAGMELAFDFNDWLARAAQTGLVTGAHRLRPSISSQKYLWPL